MTLSFLQLGLYCFRQVFLKKGGLDLRISDCRICGIQKATLGFQSESPMKNDAEE
jgi:hypothetical protein